MFCCQQGAAGAGLAAVVDVAQRRGSRGEVRTTLPSAETPGVATLRIYSSLSVQAQHFLREQRRGQ